MPLLNFIRDRTAVIPRQWSNCELRRFAPFFTGAVINVSAWRDEDREGHHYVDYFTGASSYTLSNFHRDWRGWQGLPGEIFLDLEQPLAPTLLGAFDVVFNHTTLEHVYNLALAFDNLCRLASDVVIVVVPFLQKRHGEQGDYLRLTPLALRKKFTDRGYTTLYLSFNHHRHTAVYLFAIASRHPHKWQARFPNQPDSKQLVFPARKFMLGPALDQIGCRAITNNLIVEFWSYLQSRRRR